MTNASGQKEEKVSVALRIPISLKEQLVKIAETESRDLSHQIIYMLRQQITLHKEL
jgi:hypothetical protein